MTKHGGLVFVFAAALFIGTSAYSQSTTPPILITPAAPSSCAPSAGVCYVSVNLRATNIYQKANWYTAFVTHDRKGNLLVNITGQLETTSLSDARASDPVQLKKNGTDVSISMTAPLLDVVPLTFSNMSLKFQITRTAKDGVDDLLTLLGDQSKVSSFALSQATMGVATATKAIADYLFKQSLVDSRLNSVLTFGQSSLPPAGTYAILACDDIVACNKFVPGLKYNGVGTLESNAGAVSGVTWVVFDVSYKAHRYDSFSAALSFKKSKPWAALYAAALSKAGSPSWTLAQHDQVENELRNQIDDANALLANDVDLTQDEQVAIVTAANKAIDDEYRKRYATLVENVSKSAPGGGAKNPDEVIDVGGGIKVPKSPIHLDVIPADIMKLLRSVADLRAAKTQG